MDEEEKDGDLAYSVNGAVAVAQSAKGPGVPLVHVLTDYVFDGTLDLPCFESDTIGLTGFYRSSKPAGEQAILDTQDAIDIEAAYADL